MIGLNFHYYLTGDNVVVTKMYEVMGDSSASDVFCFPSRREGLGFTAIEAMAAGLPLITSDRHGILDYSVNGITGFTCHPEDDAAFADAMRTLAEDSVLRRTMGRHNAGAAEAYDIAPVLAQMREIYGDLLDLPKTTEQPAEQGA